MFELFTIFLSSVVWGAGALWLGVLLERRKNRRDNSATATCVGCEWTSGPVPLSEAFRAAQAHREGMKHHPLVERAL